MEIISACKKLFERFFPGSVNEHRFHSVYKLLISCPRTLLIEVDIDIRSYSRKTKTFLPPRPLSLEECYLDFAEVLLSNNEFYSRSLEIVRACIISPLTILKISLKRYTILYSKYQIFTNETKFSVLHRLEYKIEMQMDANPLFHRDYFLIREEEKSEKSRVTLTERSDI